MLRQEKLSSNNQETTEPKQASGSKNDHTDVVNESVNPNLKSQSQLCSSNTEAFVGKLRLESNKIVEWQIKKDIESNELAKKLNKLEELVEKQRKNLFDLQMQCENISQEYANEMKQKEGIRDKAKNTLNICNVLQDHYQKVNSTFHSFVKIKDDISNNNKTIKENFEHLKQKFEALQSRLSEEIFSYKEKYKYQNEHHVNKKREYQQLITALEQKYQYYENEVMKMKDVNNKLRTDLLNNDNHLQQLTETINKVTTELTEKITHLEGNLSEAIDMKNIAAKEVDGLKNNVFEFEKLQMAYENSQDKRNELSKNLTETQKKVEELTVILKEDQEANNKMLNENCQLSDKIEAICASVEEYKNLLREESQDKAKLQAELIEANTNLQQIMNDIEELGSSGETEIIKLNEVIADLNKEIEKVSIRNHEHIQQKHDLEHLKEQQMNEITELNEQAESLKEAVTKNVEKSAALEEDLNNIKIEKSQMEKTLNEKQEKVDLFTNENDKLKAEIDEIQKKQGELEKALMDKQRITQEEILNKEMECSAAIKEILASMDEYKLSYGAKLKIYDQEHKELTEKISHLEKDNKELILEKKISKEKLLFQENLVANMETKLQNMESQVFQLKLDIENEKRKGFEASVNKVTNKKAADQPSNSPKRILNILTSTPKRVGFDDWSDVTDDSVDMSIFKVTSSTNVPSNSKQPARNVKVLKNNNTPKRQNIFASLLKP